MGDGDSGRTWAEPGRSAPEGEGRLLWYLPVAALAIRRGAVTLANAAALRLFEAESQAALLGRHMADLVDPEQAAVLHEALRCDAAGAPPTSAAELTLITCGGRRVEVLLEASLLGPAGDDGVLVTLRDLQRRRSGQQAIRDAEERYRRLVDYSPDAIYAHEKGVILYANAAAARLLGLGSAEELVGRHVLDHIHPEDRALVQDRILRVLREGRALTNAMARLQPVGTDRTVWVEVAASQVVFDGRQIIQVVCHDITDRMRAERDLRESEERYRELVESMPDAIYVQVDGVIVYANAASAALLGLPSAQDLVGRHVLDHVHPDYASLVGYRIHQAASHGMLEPRVFEKLRTYDGRDLYVNIRGSFVRYGDSRGVQVVLRDVTEQVQAEEHLRRQRELYSQIVESSPEGVLVVGAGTVRFANASALRLLGAKGSEHVSGSPLLRHFAAEAQAMVSSALERAYRGEFPPLEETQIIRRDGRPADVALRLTPMPYQTEQFAQVTLYDLTARKRQEAALRRREGILSAVGYAAEAFLRAGRWEDAIADVLGELGAAAEASHAFLCRRLAGPSGEELISLDCDWCAPGVSPLSALLAPQPIDLPERSTSAWRAALERGEVVYGAAGDLSARYASRLAEAGVCSVLVVPVMVDGDWWGLIGCDDCVAERDWLLAERDALRSAASILGAAIQRQNAADALQRTDQRLREVLEHSRDIAYRLDADSLQFDYVSPAARDLAGLAEQELAGVDLLELCDNVHPDDRDAFVNAYEALVCGREDADPRSAAEFRWRRRDGSYHWYSDNRSVVHSAHGGPLAIVGSVRDITEQVEARQALVQSEQRFRNVFEGSQDAIVLQDPQHRVLYANRAALAWIGRPLADIVGHSLGQAAAHLGEMVTVWSRRVQSVLQTGQVIPAADRFDLGNRIAYAESLSMPLEDATGHVYAVATIARDVTARHLGEVALRESELRARSLFESIGDAFLLFGSLADRLEILESNEAGASVFGLAAEELVGRCATDLADRLSLPTGDLPALLTRAVREGGPVYCAGARLRRRGADDEQATYLDLVAYTVHLGDEPRVALLCRDVSASRRLDAALRRSQQLEAVGRLASGVAHDFGNLLSIVKGECELLQARLADDPAAIQELRAIELVADSGTSVTRELMAFGRGEEVDREILHLNLLVRKSETILRRLVPPGSALEIEFGAEPYYIWGDAGQLTRVLVNLVLNAVDAMPDGGTVRVAIGAREVRPGEEPTPGLKPGTYAELTVSDTGRGIPEEALPHVFEPFFTTGRGRGRQGLGLSVVYGLVTQSGGAVTLDSHEGQGAVFTVLLPMVDDDLDDEAPA